MDKEYVIVMKSFQPKPNGFWDDGFIMLFRSEEELEDYFDQIRAGNDDRPFECRWSYIVVEKVPYGPYQMNEVIGWYQGVRNEENDTYDIIKIDKPDFVSNDEPGNNFTISG